MKLSFARRLTAGLAVAAAVCLSPAASRADVQILVQEVGSAALPAYSAMPTAAGGVTHDFMTDHYSITVSLTTNSVVQDPTFASLAPTITGIVTGSGPLPDLKIIITDDKFTASNLHYDLTNTAGVSNGFLRGGGTLQVDTQTVLLKDTTSAKSPDLVTGTSVAATDMASASLPPNPNLNSLTAVNDISGIPASPANYAIQQTISLSFNGDIQSTSTFTGSGGVSVQARAVPAPGGLALALIGLPLIGLRRALRKRAEVA